MEFAPYTPFHALVVGISLMSWWLLVRWGKGRSLDPRFYWVRLVLMGTTLWASTFWTLFKLMPERFNPDVAFPLHMCDYAWMACCWSLCVSEKRDALVHQLVFYWGLGLSTQAFIQPTLYAGPETLDFWFFWIPHWQIVAIGLLNFFAFGFRPRWAAFRPAALMTVAAATFSTLVNVLLSTPYCFTGEGTPENPTVIDFLGPWPLRILWLTVIVIAWFALLTKIFSQKKKA